VALDACGTSKAKAEKGLLEIALNTNFKVVIKRAPLVYSHDVKANFQSLIKI